MAMALDRPPLPPPEVGGQMGIPPTPPPTQPGLASMMPPTAGQPAPGATDPNGEVVAQTEAVKRVLEQVVRLNPVMAPFAQKCITILDTGLAAVSQAPTGAAGGGTGGGGIQSLISSKQPPPLA
jgi:hypothetical protein